MDSKVKNKKWSTRFICEIIILAGLILVSIFKFQTREVTTEDIKTEDIKTLKEELQVDKSAAISRAYLKIPMLQGTGIADSLYDAMDFDESGELQALVVAFEEEMDRGKRLELTKQIMYKWTEEESKLGVLEAFAEERYVGEVKTEMHMIIDEAFEGMTLKIYEYLMLVYHLNEYYDYGERTDGKIGLTYAANSILEILEEDQFAGEKRLADLISNIQVLGQLDKVGYSTFRDMLNEANPRYGFLADAVEKNNIITTEMSSELIGVKSANAFWISSGDYKLKGGSGDDIYIFMNAFGSSIIEDDGGRNIIALWEGVSLENMLIDEIFSDGIRESCDIKITVNGYDGEIVIKDYGAESEFEFLFADGDIAQVVSPSFLNPTSAGLGDKKESKSILPFCLIAPGMTLEEAKAIEPDLEDIEGRYCFTTKIYMGIEFQMYCFLKEDIVEMIGFETTCKAEDIKKLNKAREEIKKYCEKYYIKGKNMLDIEKYYSDEYEIMSVLAEEKNSTSYEIVIVKNQYGN